MIYVILGQTASGKTGLATRLARKFNLPLIGADAFQMYEEMNIGTAKPTKEELEGIDYHLIDCKKVSERLTVRDYQIACRSLLDEYVKKGQDVIMSGGTFLYVRAALYPYEFPAEEKKTDSHFEGLSKDEAYSLLTEKDPEAAKKFDKNNVRRVIRALEICQSGTKKSDLAMKEMKLLYPAKFFAIHMEAEAGNEIIDRRVDKMFEEGLLQEAEGLKKKYPLNLTAFQAIGYKEIFQGLDSSQSLSQIISQIKIDTHQYAKRQRTFLRHQFPSLKILPSGDIEKLVSYDIQRRQRNKISLSSLTLNCIEKARVFLVGLGGVGSLTAEGLVRLGVNQLTLIDKDRVDASNMNRQVLYNLDDVGMMKAEACREHLLKIDPSGDFKSLSQAYSDELISPEADFVFDCIDDIKAKADLVIYCLDKHIPFICSTGAALRKDSTKYKVGFLSDTGEPLAKGLKKELRLRGYDDEIFKKVPVSFSSEVPLKRQDRELGSNIIAPNAESLSLLSFFVSYWDKMCDN